MGCIRNALKRREWSVILYISVFTVFMHLEYTLIFPVLDHSAYINQQHVTVCRRVACIISNSIKVCDNPWVWYSGHSFK